MLYLRSVVAPSPYACEIPVVVFSAVRLALAPSHTNTDVRNPYNWNNFMVSNTQVMINLLFKGSGEEQDGPITSNLATQIEACSQLVVVIHLNIVSCRCPEGMKDLLDSLPIQSPLGFQSFKASVKLLLLCQRSSHHQLLAEGHVVVNVVHHP